MQQFIQTLDLIDDPDLIKFYLDAHDNIWPEIVDGIRKVGITRMDIYRDGTRLVMIVEMPDNIDRQQAFATLATLPRQAEWEDHVGRAQQCQPGATSDSKWREMTRVFTLPSPSSVRSIT